MEAWEAAAQRAMANVAERVKVHLRENILQNIYNTYQPEVYNYPTPGDRTGQLLESIEKYAEDATTWIIHSDESKLQVRAARTLAPDDWGMHTEPNLMGLLDELAQVGGTPWDDAHEPFWDFTLDELSSFLLDVFIREEFAAQGLEVSYEVQ
jgi:hypothetical protein